MRPNNLDQTLEILRLHKNDIKKFGVNRIGLFGSLVRNELRDDSDIDMIVEFDRGMKTFRHYMGLSAYLESCFARKIDLLTPESIDPEIKNNVDKEIRYERF